MAKLWSDLFKNRQNVESKRADKFYYLWTNSPRTWELGIFEIVDYMFFFEKTDREIFLAKIGKRLVFKTNSTMQNVVFSTKKKKKIELYKK